MKREERDTSPNPDSPWPEAHNPSITVRAQRVPKEAGDLLSYWELPFSYLLRKAEDNLQLDGILRGRRWAALADRISSI